MFSVLLLTGALFANDTEHKFSLAIKKAELPKFDLDSISVKSDFLFSLEQTIQANQPNFNNADLNFYQGSNFWKGVLKGAWKGALIGGGFALAYIIFNDPDSWQVISNKCAAIFCVAIGTVLGSLIGGISEIEY